MAAVELNSMRVFKFDKTARGRNCLWPTLLLAATLVVALIGIRDNHVTDVKLDTVSLHLSAPRPAVRTFCLSSDQQRLMPGGLFQLRLGCGRGVVLEVNGSFGTPTACPGFQRGDCDDASFPEYARSTCTGRRTCVLQPKRFSCSDGSTATMVVHVVCSVPIDPETGLAIPETCADHVPVDCPLMLPSALANANTAPPSSEATASRDSVAPVPAREAEDRWWEGRNYGVVMLEPRRHPALVWLVRDTVQKMPPSWKVSRWAFSELQPGYYSSIGRWERGRYAWQRVPHPSCFTQTHGDPSQTLVFYSNATETLLRQQLADLAHADTGAVLLRPFPVPGDASSGLFANDMWVVPHR
jgi:hypothetical protein